MNETPNPNGADWLEKFTPSADAANPNGGDWAYKFAPRERAPVAAQTAAVTPPAPPDPKATPHEQVWQAILAYNNGLDLFKTASIWRNPVKGVVIHKITPEEAQALATRVKPAAEEQDLPLTFVLACLAIESTLDEWCENGNFGPGESNTAIDPLGYDMGVAQLKLRYLVALPGVADEHGTPTIVTQNARNFAFDVDKAVPYHCSLMATHRLWAQKIISENTSSVPDPKLSNDLLLATGAYNFGDTGMLAYYESGQFPNHCQQVINLEAYFAKALGVASVFADLA